MLETIKEKWPEILDYLKTEFSISDVSFNTWILPMEVVGMEDDTIFIRVPEESIGLQYIKKKYYHPMKVSIGEILNASYEVKFTLSYNSSEEPFPAAETVPSPDIYEKANLNPKYTFSTFVVGENSNLAHAASLAVAESPAEIYNPLYIYGGVGLGKTHLMHSIAHFILTHNPDMSVLYVSSETFTNEIIESIRNESPSAVSRFREKYRNVDVLLIDDIQFISGKESTQQEFFHTFNSLYENKKQIVISSDKPPKELDKLEERLCSRFLWGLTVDIQSPSYETRVAILKKKLEQEKTISVPDDVLQYIAANVSSNIRELEGALTKIIAYAKLSSSQITLPFAESVLKDMLDDNSQSITPDLIIKVVAEYFFVSISDLLSSKRSQEIVYPRQIVMYLCRTLTDVSLSVIGKKLGNKDHTTVMHGYEKIQRLIETDPSIKKDVEELKKKILPA